jgi:flagellar basal body-associated protein FliL
MFNNKEDSKKLIYIIISIVVVLLIIALIYYAFTHITKTDPIDELIIIINKKYDSLL